MMVRPLLAEGQVNLDSKTSYGRTPLPWTVGNGARGGSPAAARYQPSRPDSKEEDGQTPLSYAAEYGHEAEVKLLLADGRVDLDSKDYRYGHTPLLWAAYKGHDAVFKLLLAIDQANPDSGRVQMPLSCAAKYGYGGVVKLLLTTG